MIYPLLRYINRTTYGHEIEMLPVPPLEAVSPAGASPTVPTMISRVSPPVTLALPESLSPDEPSPPAPLPALKPLPPEPPPPTVRVSPPRMFDPAEPPDTPAPEPPAPIAAWKIVTPPRLMLVFVPAPPPSGHSNPPLPSPAVAPPPPEPATHDPMSLSQHGPMPPPPPGPRSSIVIDEHPSGTWKVVVTALVHSCAPEEQAAPALLRTMPPRPSVCA